MKIKVDISSIEEKLPEASENIDGMISLLMETIGADVEAYAKMHVPVDRGHLQAGIKNEMLKPKTFQVSDSVHYGVYWEFGTKKHWMPFVDRAGNVTDMGRWAMRVWGVSEEKVRQMRGVKVQAREMRFLRGGLEHATSKIDESIRKIRESGGR